MGIGFIKSPGVQKVTITVASQTGGVATGGGTYKKKQSVTVRATPNTGYHFVGWYSNNIQLSTSASYTFIAAANITIQARFAINTYTVTVTGGSGGGTFNHGAICTVTASVADNYTFTGWTINGSVVSTSLTYSFAVTGNVTIVANKKLAYYDVYKSASLRILKFPYPSGMVPKSVRYEYGRYRVGESTNYSFTNMPSATANYGTKAINITAKNEKTGNTVSLTSTLSWGATELETMISPSAVAHDATVRFFF